MHWGVGGGALLLSIARKSLYRLASIVQLLHWIVVQFQRSFQLIPWSQQHVFLVFLRLVPGFPDMDVPSIETLLEGQVILKNVSHCFFSPKIFIFSPFYIQVFMVFPKISWIQFSWSSEDFAKFFLTLWDSPRISTEQKPPHSEPGYISFNLSILVYGPRG